MPAIRYSRDEFPHPSLSEYRLDFVSGVEGLVLRNEIPRTRGIPNNLAPYVAQVAIGKLPCLSIFGNDYKTPDGTGVRDYIHVVDLAQGHLNAVDYCQKNHGTVAINLGTGHGSSVLDVVHAYEKASGIKINYKICGRRAGDIDELFADVTKAKELLGWEAKLDLDAMCRDSWNFIKKNPNGL